MKKKILITLTLIIIIFSATIIPKTNADNTQVVSIQNTELKAGEKINVFIDLDNINFNVSKIVLATDVYMEPLLDAASGTPDTSFNNKTFTIENITTNSIYLSYTIPNYVAGGTKINIVASIYDDTNIEQVKSNFEINVISEEKNNENNQTNEDNNREISENSSQKTQSSSMQNTNRNSTSGIYLSSETATYKGSRNNYLKSLSVSGYDLNFEFNKTNNTYFITVPNNVTSITVNATKEDSTAKVSISGNTNLKEVLNKVLISVLAQNGDVRNYRIYVIREV